MFISCPCCCCMFAHCCSMRNLYTYNKLPQENTTTEVNYMYRQKYFTTEELAQYDGSSGKPAYVAINGIVYDVSLNRKWGGGTHFGLYAGRDLTAQFQGCHPGGTILKKLHKVGVLK